MRPAAGKPAWSLVIFTVFTQAAVGLFLVGTWLERGLARQGLAREIGTHLEVVLPVVLVLLATGFLAAFFHLGRPGAARFALANLKASWLSRELTLGVAFAGAVAVLAVAGKGERNTAGWYEAVQIGAIVLGLALVLAIAKVYMIRTVPAWNTAATPAAFLLTTLLLGPALFAGILSTTTPQIPAPVLTRLASFVSVAALCQVLVTATHVIRLIRQTGAARESAIVLLTIHGKALGLRVAGTLLGAVVLLGGIGTGRPEVTVAALGILIAAEFLGRALFYASHRRAGL
jgi:DMSO reductase anchor subunit